MRDVKGANGFIVARVDASGNVSLGPEPGPLVGHVGESGEIFDDDAGVHQVGRVDGEGNVMDMRFVPLANVDSWGRVYTVDGQLLGTVEKPCDAGVLVFLAGQLPQPQPITPEQEGASLMSEALDLASEQSYPKVRKDYKPLTDRDLFMEHLRRE
jgi:hypothetical protein